MADRLHDGLRHVAEAMSVTRDEFRASQCDGADMLLDGLVSHGYVRERGGRFAVTDAGRLALGEGA